jgi:hypothetical protein
VAIADDLLVAEGGEGVSGWALSQVSGVLSTWVSSPRASTVSVLDRVPVSVLVVMVVRRPSGSQP